MNTDTNSATDTDTDTNKTTLREETAALRELFGDVIASYTRADAIADGVLVDVTETAKKLGIRFPIAMTATAFAACAEWTDADPHGMGQTTDARLWDILYMFSFFAKANGGSEILFHFYCVPRTSRTGTARRATLKAICGAGDSLEPVITIMLPNED